MPWFLRIHIISIFHLHAELNSKDFGQLTGDSCQPFQMAVATKFQFILDLLSEKFFIAICVQFQLFVPHAMIGMNDVNLISQPIQVAFNS